MGSNVLLSVIIPTYNDGKLLQRSVDSVLHSSLQNIEVIIVNDGSSEKLELFCNDKRVSILNQDNQGVSVARNNGLNHSTGEYILFLDADDYLVSGWERFIFNINKSDLILFNYETDYGFINNIKENKKLSNDEFKNYRNKMIKNPTNYLTVWGKLLKREIILNQKIMFDSNLNVSEDGDFMIRYLLKSSTICLVDNVLYHYSSNPSSVMHQFDGKKITGYITSISKSKAVIDSESKSVKQAFDHYVVMHLNLIGVHEIFDIRNKQTFNDKVRHLKMIIGKDIFKNSLKSIKYTDCRSVNLLPILLIKLKWYSVVGIIYLLRSKRNNL